MMPKREKKIVRFPYQNTPFSFATSIVDMVKENEVQCMLVAGRMNDGELFMGRSHVSYEEMMNLIHHLQMYALDLRDREDYE